MTTFTVTNLNDSGAGSLRDAISSANADPAAGNQITFAVNGVITLASDLPAISRAVAIDATTAPGHVANGVPAVEINFNGHAGLVFAAGSDGSQLLGFAITHASGHGVTLEASGIGLGQNYIGLNLLGQAAGNGGDGVHLTATSSGNFIGLNPTAASNIVSNVISANGGNGIGLVGSTSNILVNNYIGTDPTGTVAIANAANGINASAGSHGNEIGGTAFTDSITGAVNDPTGDKGTVTPVFVVPPLGNLVSGNGANGILIDADSRNNILNGNFVGTTASGNAALGNVLDGVAIVGSDNNSLIGCTFEQNPFVYYNVLSGNGGNGLRVTDSDGTTIQANFFGTGANNSTVIGNALDGVLVNGDSKNTLMGGPIPLGNVSSGNGANAVEVADTASFFTSFNTFGGLLAFGGAAPNGLDGLHISSTGGNQNIQTNVFSANGDDGIEISGDAWGVTLDPNILGLDTGGTILRPNQDNGLEIGGNAHDNMVGGHQLSILPQNIFSGNMGYGIAIIGNAHDNQVINTFIGLDNTVTVALANQKGGILIGDTAHDNRIGDVPSAPGRPVAVVISGNLGNGITLEDGTSGTEILNNIIGLTTTGTQFPNSGEPIVTGTSTGNVIVGNDTFACFAARTRIATPDGAVAVERLSVGDAVLTCYGRAAPVRWIGHRRVDVARHADPDAVRPIRIAAHAFGPGQPVRDLLLSPDHAVFADGVLIPVKYLLNGTTIAPTRIRAVTYFHIELDRHDVILAEGLAAESYLDTGDRRSFANGADVIALHPVWGGADAALVRDALGCAPLVVTGPQLEAVRRRLEVAARRTG